MIGEDETRSHAPRGNALDGRSASPLPRSGGAVRDDAERRHENKEICPDCHGSRLRPEARAVRIAGKAIHEVTAANVLAAEGFFRALEFPEDRRPIADPITSEILSRLEFLESSRARLSHARPPGGKPQRRRVAARAAGQRAGLGAGRRVLRA